MPRAPRSACQPSATPIRRWQPESRSRTRTLKTSAMGSDDLVERRMRYIDRQKKLGHGLDVRFEGLKPQGSGGPNRHGLPKVPIDQHLVSNWPVLSLSESP